MKKKHKVYRDASSGEFTSKEYAEAHKSTTVSEVVTTGDEGSDNKEETVKQSDGEAESRISEQK